MIFPAHAGTAGEKRPGLNAVLARTFIFAVLYLLSAVILRRPRSDLGWLLAFLTKSAFGFAAAVNLVLWMALRRLAYRLDETGVRVCLGMRTIAILYTTIATVVRQDNPWTIRKGGVLVYAKEAPQLIKYVAQLGGFIVSGTRQVMLYSTLSSYHHPAGLILITTSDGKQYGLSPAEPERFVEELRARCPQLARA